MKLESHFYDDFGEEGMEHWLLYKRSIGRNWLRFAVIYKRQDSVE